MALGKFRSDNFQIFLIKTRTCDFNGAVGVDQEAGRHVGDSVGVRSGITFCVQHNRKGDSALVGEFLCGAGAILGNSEEGDVFTAVALVEAVQKREGELANRAGNFEERGENRAPF